MKVLIISEGQLEKIGSKYYTLESWIRFPLNLSSEIESLTFWSTVKKHEDEHEVEKGASHISTDKMKIVDNDDYNTVAGYYALLPFKFYEWQKKASNLIKEHDVIILRVPSPMLPRIAKLSEKHKKPFVMLVVGDKRSQSDKVINSNKMIGTIYRAINEIFVYQEKVYARKAALVYVYSEELAKRHRHCKGEVKIIQDAQLTMKDIIKREDTCQREIIKLLRVCWLMPSKGIEYLLGSVALLLKRGFPVTLDIIGREKTSGYKRKLELLIDDLKIKDAVHFLEWVPYDKIGKVYLDSDIQVLSSLAEGTPRVIAEGFASGLPLVCTDVGGCTTFLTHEKNAILVPSKDTEAMAKGIERVIRDNSLRRNLIENGYEAARSVTFEILGKQIVSDIRKLALQG